MSALAPVLVAVLALAAASAALTGPSRARLAGRISTGAAALACALSAALAARVAVHGALSAVISTSGGRVLAGLYVNRITAVLLLLVCGVSAVVQAFAGSYLRGDVRATRFFACTSLLTAATAAIVSAATLVGLAVAWSIAGVALCLLLNMYAGLPAAREGARKTVRALAIGDGALWIAVALALSRWGDLDLRNLSVQAPTLRTDGTLLALFACLVLVAALARSAQLPLQRWLPATLAAPTPVSALLHAGVINAGGVLLVRLSPLFGASVLASTLAFALGAATLVHGTLLMITKPDVKGALAHSTMGQMGFMIMTCGLGAFAAAVFHLVAHGMYKATLFLGSGSAVHRHVRHSKAPPRATRTVASSGARAGLSALLGAAAVVGAASVLHPHVGGRSGSGALLLFAWATAARGAWGLLGRDLARGVLAAALAGVVGAVWAYVAWLGAFTGFFAADLGRGGLHPASPWLLAALVPALAVLAALRSAAGARRLRALHDSVYVYALSAGHVALGATRRARPAAAASAPARWPLLQAGSQAARS